MTTMPQFSVLSIANRRPDSIDQAGKEDVAGPEKHYDNRDHCGPEKPTGPIARLKENQRPDGKNEKAAQ